MKGLWIKDMKILKNQRSFFVVIAAVCAGFLLTGQSVFSVISYAAVMFSILVITTIGYDEQNNGMGFLLALPVSREMYVLEKYLLGLLLPVAAIAAGAVLSSLFSLMRSSAYETGEGLSAMLVSLLAAVIIQAVTIPIQLKFGAEKSRIAMLVAAGCMVLVGYIAISAVRWQGMDLEAASMWIAQASPVLFLVCGAAAVVILMGISYLISLRIMKRKQF